MIAPNAKPIIRGAHIEMISIWAMVQCVAMSFLIAFMSALSAMVRAIAIILNGQQRDRVVYNSLN